LTEEDFTGDDAEANVNAVIVSWELPKTKRRRVETQLTLFHRLNAIATSRRHDKTGSSDGEPWLVA